MNKRGLSEVVTTIIIILLILVAIGGIWAVLNNTLFSQANRISLSGLTLDLEIKSVNINSQTGLASIKVLRNLGEGNLTGINFRVRDSDSAEIFEVRVENFLELAERTFVLNLSERSQDITIAEINEIAIAPIYLLPDSTDKTGDIVSTFKILSDDIIGGGENFGSGTCTIDDNCDSDYWTDMNCNSATELWGVFHDNECLLGQCYTNPGDWRLNESCGQGYVCANAACVPDQIACSSNPTICNQYSGILSQQCTDEITLKVVTSTWSCGTSGYCEENTNTATTTCTNQGSLYKCDEVNGVPACYYSPQCTDTIPCSTIGTVCSNGYCIQETPIILNGDGIVLNTWAPIQGQVEYFSSVSFNPNLDIGENYYVKFKSGDETRCLQVREYSSTSTNFYYIRLNVTDAEIEQYDTFNVWQTSWGCSQ